jgi:hypothetical protein
MANVCSQHGEIDMRLRRLSFLAAALTASGAMCGPARAHLSKGPYPPIPSVVDEAVAYQANPEHNESLVAQRLALN